MSSQEWHRNRKKKEKFNSIRRIPNYSAFECGLELLSLFIYATHDTHEERTMKRERPEFGSAKAMAKCVKNGSRAEKNLRRIKVRTSSSISETHKSMRNIIFIFFSLSVFGNCSANWFRIVSRRNEYCCRLKISFFPLSEKNEFQFQIQFNSILVYNEFRIGFDFSLCELATKMEI